MASDVATRAGVGRAAPGRTRTADITRAWRGGDARSALRIGAAVALFVPVAVAGADDRCLIRMIDGGPALFWQERTGLEGRPFRMPKFRTMAGNGDVTTAIGDARVTRLGRVLRRFHADEAPQLWSVLRGRMSFIGPRPEQPGLARTYAAHLADYELRPPAAPRRHPGLAEVRAPYAGNL